MVRTHIRIAVLIVAMILIAVPSLAQDVLVNELEFSPYIIMPETLLHKLLKNDTDYVIYDIRDRESFHKGHIKGALNYPWEKWDNHNLETNLTRDKIVVLVSEDGEESFSALKYLLERGYSELWVVEGGMQNWVYKEWLVKSE